MAYRFISRESVGGKTILFHSMMDLPVVNGKIDVSSRRFLADVAALKMLSEKGARLVVFTWQSRPGKKDFLHLDQHAAAVGKRLGKEVKQFRWNEDFASAIRAMRDGDIIFLDNVRMHPDQCFGCEKKPEDYAHTAFVKSLAPLVDCFCNNALSQSHRAECSVIGFTSVLPSFVGPSLETEMRALDRAQAGGKPRVLLLGGMKNEDSIGLIPRFLRSKRVDLVLAGGLLGQLFLRAKGVEFGRTDEWVEERPFLEFGELVGDARLLIEEFGGRILMPVDVAVDAGGKRESIAISGLPTGFLLKDIGDKTIELFSEKLQEAKTIIWNGPMGVYEEKPFLEGTRLLANALVNSGAYTVIGGGDTETAAERCGIPLERFSHASLAGKAFLRYLLGEKLPGLVALEKWGKK
jgi:phosphoglycerate kinase